MADVVINADNKNPKELFGQGVRAYVLQDYSAAVAALGKASELLVIEHGDDLHESLGEVYLYYGKSLLGLSREESEPLGDAVPRNDESSEEENVEETEENEESATKEDNESAGEGSSTQEPGGRTDFERVPEFIDHEDDPSDLQLAWEVLELAKKIFQRQGEAAKKNLAETLAVLGEVSLESENFESAVNDISEGLKIQKELFEEDSRTVAETYYKLGVAYSTGGRIDAAVNSFNNSLDYLNRRISSLGKSVDKNKGIDDEINEIKNLIPEIEEKIADMRTYKDEAMTNIFTALKDGPKNESSSSSSNSSKPVTDISHLVKRKRKADEIDKDATVEEQPAKKTNL
ncbi:histone-binding protein N1/N2 isoform X2 [Diorhabda sublineata]|uniref:histone-binding protein N1/N2 isoform X2 n=1 Tax=Diorhabda sublineata TaxID=1163346 RepID=UPI0024E158AE|nr:histone-binding protein N1/N2 isoform X2 [Diorhabda sublineata]